MNGNPDLRYYVIWAVYFVIATCVALWLMRHIVYVP